MNASVPVDEREVPCRFVGCPRLAIGRYEVSEGCVCFPQDREQDLCIQHAESATPIGTFRIMLVYQPSLLAIL